MKRAMTIGLATGVILSLIFIGAGLLRHSVPDTTIAQQLFFYGLFLLMTFSVFWISLNYFTRSTSARWGILNVCGLTSSVVAAVIFSVTTYFYTQYIDTTYLPQLMQQAQQNYSSASVFKQGEWTWFKSPYNFALSNFQTSIVLLGIISLLTSSVYYLMNRNRPDEPVHHRNHELIY